MRFKNEVQFHRALFTIVLLLSGCSGGGADTSKTAAITTTTTPPVTSDGTDFYLTLPDHLCVSDPASCNGLPVTNKLIIAAATATTGEITFNKVVTPFSVVAGKQTVIALDPGVVLTSNELVEAKGIHVTALAPVSIHVVSENATSADGYLALPVAGLGTEYYVMSKSSSRYSGSEFAVVATQDATTVTITPAAAGASKPSGVTFTVALNAGQTYQLANTAHADMTGTLVTSDKPLAVFGGHRCADAPSGLGYCDYLVEQIPAISVWGNTFHTSPFAGRARYTVRVIASQNNTTFTTVPAGLIGTLNDGQFADVDLTGAAEIVSTNPVLVAQFIRGYDDDTAAEGDPSMVIVTPAEMGMTDTTFGVHGLAGTTGAYINIVTETSAIANLTLDSVAIDSARFTSMGGSSIYSLGTVPVAAGAHKLLGTNAYTALVYDYGIKWNAVSYAYPVSSKLSVPASSTTPSLPIAGCDDDDDDNENYDHTKTVTGEHHHHHHHRRRGGHEHECHHPS